MRGFPPPQFLQMPGAGVNISDHGIKVIRLEEQDGAHLPSVLHEHKIENDIVIEGDIKRPNELVEELSTLRERYDLHFIYFSIPEEHGYVFGLRIPQVPREEVHDTIAVRLTEHVPLSNENAVFGCDLVKELPREQEMHINVTALPRDIVEEYQSICLAADLIPLKFEVEAQSISRAVTAPDEEAALMIVDIGRTRTGLSIVNEGVVQYTATLSMGGDMLTSAIAKQLDIPFEEADMIKQKRGFERADTKSDLHIALVNCVSALVDEIQRRFDYWGSHASKPGHTNEEIQKIVLTGGNASVPGLSEHISRAVGVPVELADVWRNAFSPDDYIPDVDFNHSQQYASAIGLALNNT